MLLWFILYYFVGVILSLGYKYLFREDDITIKILFCSLFYDWMIFPLLVTDLICLVILFFPIAYVSDLKVFDKILLKRKNCLVSCGCNEKQKIKEKDIDNYEQEDYYN